MAKDFEIKLSRPSDNRDFFKGVLGNYNKSFERGIKQGLHQVGFNLVKTFRDGVQRQPKTGKIYITGGKGSRKGRRGRNKNRHQASAPGEYPAILSGDYLNAIDFDVRGSKELEFGNSDEKATILELGSKNMAPRAALTQSVDARSKDMDVILSDQVKKQIKKLNRPLAGRL